MAMELDLDAFLDSHASDEDDDDVNLHSVHGRTVDEILLNESSSSDSSPSSPNRDQPSHRDATGTPKTLSPDYTSSSPPQFIDKPQPPSSSYQSRVGFSSAADSLSLNWTTHRNVLPPLFAGNSSSGVSVRSNVKPGAALAAAAAASRSVPTPHADAIKLRRATPTDAPLLHKQVVDNNEGFVSESTSLDSEVVSELLFGLRSQVSSAASSEFCKSDFDSSHSSQTGEVTLVNNGLSLSLGTEIIVKDNFNNEANEVLPLEGIKTQTEVVQNVSEANELTVNNFVEVSTSSIFEPHITTTPPVTEQGQQNLNEYCINSDETCADVKSELLTVNESIENATGYDNGTEVEEDLTFSISETNDLEDVIPQSEEEEEVSLAGKDNILPTDGSEPVEDIILQLESTAGCKRTGEKSQSSMKPLDLAEELEKKYAFTGLHWEEGAASQPMRLEGVRRGSTVLGYFDVDANNTITRTISSESFRRDYGSAQVLAVHLNFIAVGMSKGVIVRFPSKQSPHHADNDAKIVMLGIQGDKSQSSVTAMCFNRQGDLLFAGYADGHYTIWDVQKASALKVISEHKAPVVHILYLGQDSQVSRQFNVVSGDSKGVVKLIRFTIVPWVNRISFSKPVTLLDESTSTVVCASPLLSDEYSGGSPMSAQGSATVYNSGIGSMMGGVVGGDWKLFEGSSLVEEGVVIFVTHQSALVAKVNPSVEVYAQLPKPDGVREGSMPYAAWKYMAQPYGSSAENVPEKTSERVPLLAIAWDRKVQVAKLVKSELKIYGKWTLESVAVGVGWLDDQLLVVLTLNEQLCLFAKDGTVIHQTSFAVDGARGDDLIAYHTQFINTFGNPEKAYHNCVSVRGASIYTLGPMHLAVSRLLPWKERIEVLRKAGDWMGALNMAMSLYDGQAHGVIDLPRTLDDVQKSVMPYLVELLLSYVDEVFSYISVAFCNQIGKLDQLDDSNSSSSSVHSEIQEQFTRVGGVAVEFCVHIKRTDILFDEILSRFVSVQHKETFLELLEPYILKDMLGSLPPEIMQALVEHYSMKGWLQRIEQCVLHMDISSLDFNQVVRLCREHRLYGALIYLFNKGLDDFRAPLEELLAVLQNSQRESAVSIGYRMLVYLKYCFSGLAFPPGHGIISPARLPSVRIELLQFLLEDSNNPNSSALASSNVTGACPNLYHLLELDTEATLDVLRCAFVEDEIPQVDHTLPDSANSHMDSIKENDSTSESQNLVQKIVNVFVLILDKGYSRTYNSICNDDVESNNIWPSKNDISHVFEFIAYYVSCERAIVSKSILSEIFEYLTSKSDIDIHPSVSRQNLQTLKKREKQVIGILEVVTETYWDASYLLLLCEKAQFHQVCGCIHAIRHRNIAALESYMKDADEPIHAFSFISCTLLQLDGKESDAFQSAIMSRIPDLVKLSREGTFFLVVDHFSGDNERTISELDSHPESLFLHLKTVIEVHSTGTLNFSCFTKGDNVDIPNGRRDRGQHSRIKAFLERISDFPNLMRNNPVHVTDKIIEQYLELLCQYEPSSVLKFLETFESYRVEHCLRLCQNYGIVDAAAFLLERVGDVGTALSLTLSGLNDKFLMLDATVRSLLYDAGVEHFNTVLQKKEVNEILDILHASIGLCQRNSPRMDFDESKSLWFRLLDSFCEPLMDSYNGQMDPEGEKKLKPVSLGREENEAACKISWKVSRSQRSAHILRKLFSVFIKEIVEGMIGYVRLPTIMLKLLSDNGNQEFGDFKLTILGMLGTYDFERRILDTAKSLIEDDTFYTMSLLKKGASHGYGPMSLVCCICNCPLTKNSTSSRIQVFSCGHTTHLLCELQEKEASQRDSSAGCPICTPKKKALNLKSKSALAEAGLVGRYLSRNQIGQGTIGLHQHESDIFEGSYGYHTISRFEILTNLQKEHRLNHVENPTQLRLAPPAVYHEKVKKGIDLFSGESSGGKVQKGIDPSRGESSSGFAKIQKTSKTKQLRELKVKGSLIRLPLKSHIFGKEKISKQ